MTKELIKRILSSIIIMPISLIIIIQGSIYFLFLLLLCFIISLYEWHRMQIAKTFKVIGSFFLFLSFFTIYEIRNGFNSAYWYFLLIIFICIVTDIGGYVFGKIFKGPKLTVLSPNKTYAGMLGSFLLSFLLYLVLINTNLINEKYYLNFLLFVFLISSVSQIGDISISYFKRLSNVKDTGKIIPGHGGLLDRIDGMIFAFPMSYIILSFEYFNNIL